MKTRSKRKTSQMRLPLSVRRRIGEESRLLSLSENDYLLLLTQIATVVRGAVWPDGVKDPETLLSIANNPFILQMVGALAGTVWSQAKGALDTAQAPDKAPSAASAPPASPSGRSPAFAPSGPSSRATVKPPMPAPRQEGAPDAPAQTPPRRRATPTAPLIPPQAASPSPPDAGVITLVDPMTGRRVYLHRRGAL
ncbi:MAG: hypothetical protein ACYCVB_02990 [Bacilli bacterium]